MKHLGFFPLSLFSQIPFCSASAYENQPWNKFFFHKKNLYFPNLKQ